MREEVETEKRGTENTGQDRIKRKEDSGGNWKSEGKMKTGKKDEEGIGPRNEEKRRWGKAGK